MSSREDFISGNGEIVQFWKGGRENGLGRLLATFRNSGRSRTGSKLLPVSSAARDPGMCAFLEVKGSPSLLVHNWGNFPPLASLTQWIVMSIPEN